MAEIELRVSRRLLMFPVTGTILLGLLGLWVTATSPSLRNFAGLVPLVFLAVLVSALWRSSVVTDGQDLVIRDYWSRRRIPRSEIIGFDIGPAWGRVSGGATVRI